MATSRCVTSPDQLLLGQIETSFETLEDTHPIKYRWERGSRYGEVPEGRSIKERWEEVFLVPKDMKSVIMKRNF